MSESEDLPLPDATTQMPAAAAGPPQGTDSTAKPWYQRPGPLLALLFGVVAVLGLGGFLLVQSLDDDGPSTVSILRFDRTDVEGNPIERDLIAEVTGQAGAEDRFLWLIPPNANAPDPALDRTSASSGRAEFQWGPTNDVEIPEEWTSTITLIEQFGAEESLVANNFDCSLERRGQDAGLVTIAVTFDNPADLTAPRTATYLFPGFSFLAGDVMTCVISNGVAVAVPDTSTTTTPPPAETTTSTTTTTLPPETTTTTTTTLPPETTTTTTTLPAETTTTVAVETTVMDVIDSRADLSRLAELIDLAGLRATLSDPGATLTMFTPNNDAFAAAESAPAAPDYSDPAVVEPILLTHVHTAGKLTAAEVFALPEIAVVEPGPHAIDGGAQTIGGVAIIEVDVDGGNGFLHVLNGVLTPAAA
jgi:uncharacterized surface protein with fasciclin (FAS1) repeats